MTLAELEARVEKWRALLAPEWRITITTDGPDDREHRACITADDDYLHAALYVAPATRDEALGELDVTIVHELLHLHFRELRRTIDLIDGHVHRDAATVLEDRFLSVEELTVERLARVIARLEHPDGLLYGTVLECPPTATP